MSFCRPRFRPRKLAPISILAVSSCLVFGQTAPALSAQGEGSGETTERNPTPHLPDGHPDLNGYWDTGAQSNITVTKQGDSVRAVLDLGANRRPANVSPPPRREPPSVPSYKPEFMDKVKDLAKNSTSKDSAFFANLSVFRESARHTRSCRLPKWCVFFLPTG